MFNLKKESNQELLKIIEIHIPYDSARKLSSAFSHLRLGDDKSWLRTSHWFGTTIKHCLTKELNYTISNFKENKDQQALIIRGLPIDQNLCKTPYSGYVSPSKLPIISAINIGIYQLAKIEPTSYQSENDGLLFRHVVPSLKGRNDKSSHGSKHTFGHHVDNPDLPLTNDGVAYCRYDKKNTTPLTTEAAAALVMWEAQLKNTELNNAITYQPGDFLIIKNQRLMHSREGFSPRDDGTDRWLIRLFGMSSLERIIPINEENKHIAQD